jgi:hypothetical protein
MVQSKWIVDFKEHYNLCFTSSRKTKTYVSGIIQAIKVCADHLGHNAKQWTNERALDWANAGFPVPVAPVLEGAKALSVPVVVCVDLHTIRKQRQRDQSSNRCMPSDQKGSESLPSGSTSSANMPYCWILKLVASPPMYKTPRSDRDYIISIGCKNNFQRLKQQEAVVT